ncbi:MAG: DnaJ domain-containing protein [Anaerolineae bacterium]|nr:DnaJ domain-containing protein [Anaerolineae bacterium]
MTHKSVKDYYAILGVPSTASLEEIRLAYRRQARAYHPDLSTDPHAEERFKEINEAYDVLANSEKRQAYDYFTGDAPETTFATEEPQPASAPAQEPVVAQPKPRVEPVTKSGPSQPRRRVMPPTWAILLIVLGACIMIAVVVGGVLSLQRNRPTGGADAVSVTKLTTFLSPPEIPAELTVLQEGNTPLETLAPTQLSVGGTSFPVVAVLPEQGRWPLPTEQQELAMWMYGTVINYVVGLPYASTTESLLAGLSSADRITLTLENGTQLAFGSPQAKRVDSGDTAPMSQDRPGLTLMVLGGDQPARLIVSARYLPEAVVPTTEQHSDGLTVRVVSSGLVENAAPESADSWYFVIEYQITNTLASAVDPTYFDMVVEDAAGQRYVLNEPATVLGDAGRLTALVGAGDSVRGSAGYVIPRTISAPLVWRFRADPTSADQATVVLDFEPPRPGPAEPDVELYEVFLDADRGVIVISGTVYNDGESDLLVAAEAVEVTSGSGRSSLEISAPLLPWTIPPDDYQDFELQFAVPEGADSVLLNVLGFTFEIEGLSP